MERATEHRRDGLCNESFRAQPGSRRYRCVRPEGHSGAHEIAPVGAAHERRVMEQIRTLESRLAAAEARAHRIEAAARAAAREAAGGDDDECLVCLELGRCPRCTGNRETANRAKCEMCELRAALDLPVVVRTRCYRCDQWSEVRARFDDDHRREWLCASCRAALEGGG